MTRLDLARQLALAAQIIAIRKTSKPLPTAEPVRGFDPAVLLVRYQVARARP